MIKLELTKIDTRVSISILGKYVNNRILNKLDESFSDSVFGVMFDIAQYD